MDEILEDIQAQVIKLLDQVGISNPPINPFEICQRLKFLVIYDSRMENRARTKKIDGTPVFILKPDPRRERLHWALAHELGEMTFGQLPETHSALMYEREKWANHFASFLLMPHNWFEPEVRLHRGDILAIKNIFKTASHELIASRMSLVYPGSIVSIFDQGRLIRRTGQGITPPRNLLPEELRLWQGVHLTSQPEKLHAGNWFIRCWPIHEQDFKREILFTQYTEES